MKKICVLALVFAMLTALVGCGIRKSGEHVIFSAKGISKTPEKVEKTVTIKGTTFTYYNVYNDGNGNFVLADNTSYIKNENLQFGIRFGGEDSAVIKPLDSEQCYEPMSKEYDNGDWGYQVYMGFIITIANDSALTNVNIGKITHWC